MQPSIAVSAASAVPASTVLLWLTPPDAHASRRPSFVPDSGQLDTATISKPARSPLAEGVLLFDMVDSCLHRYELHPFFRITDCSASLFRLRSATNFRSRVFSSLSCLA